MPDFCYQECFLSVKTIPDTVCSPILVWPRLLLRERVVIKVFSRRVDGTG